MHIPSSGRENRFGELLLPQNHSSGYSPVYLIGHLTKCHHDSALTALLAGVRIREVVQAASGAEVTGAEAGENLIDCCTHHLAMDAAVSDRVIVA